MLTEPIHHYGYDVFNWKGYRLYFEKKLLVELVPHEVYPDHWHLKFSWRDEKTPEFFNVTNARDNAKRIALHRLNYDAWE